jgi:hypothetical protein
VYNQALVLIHLASLPIEHITVIVLLEPVIVVLVVLALKLAKWLVEMAVMVVVYF